MAAPEAGERRNLGVWPVWALVTVLLALGFWLFHAGKPPGTTSVTVPAGDYVEFTGRVDEGAPSRAFWIGLQDGKRLLVLPIERDTPMDAVRYGEMVSVAGRLEKPASQDVLVREWNLDPRTAAILAREPLYVRAERIRPAAQK